MVEQLFIIPILLFSVVIHEMAHGWMALRLGDTTARDAGRLTLNPIPHIDLFGSILVPLFSILAAGRVFIAWAKPVPVNPWNFRNLRRDDMLVSIVGPVSNLCLALACSVMVILLGAIGAGARERKRSDPGEILGVPAEDVLRRRVPQRRPRGIQPHPDSPSRRLPRARVVPSGRARRSLSPSRLPRHLLRDSCSCGCRHSTRDSGSIIGAVFAPFHALMGYFLPLAP